MFAIRSSEKRKLISMWELVLLLFVFLLVGIVFKTTKNNPLSIPRIKMEIPSSSGIQG